MRALVTGASGFVGSHLVPRLFDEGHEVAVLARPSTDTSKVPSNVSRIVDTGDIEELKGAIGQFNPDVCFHLATHFVGQHQSADVAPLIEANIAFGARLLEALADLNDVALVNVGTVWQHYQGADYFPVSLYAATKQAFQDLVAYYAASTSIRSVTVELTDTYGPGDTRRKLIAILMQNAGTDAVMKLSGGEQVFDVLYVGDAVDALLMAPEHASHEHPVFGLRNESPSNLRSFVEQMTEIVGQPIHVEWGALPYREREMMTPWVATPTLPGWSPKTSLREGVTAMMEATRNG